MQLDNIAAYWNKRAEGYSASIHKELLGEDAHRFQSLLHSAMPAGNNLNCLDMGCGPGFLPYC